MNNICNGTGFFQAPDWVCDAKLTVYEFAVIAYLYRTHKKNRNKFPSRETMSQAMSISVSSVDRAIAALKKKSVDIGGEICPMLKVTHRMLFGKRTSSEYTLPSIIKRIIFDETFPTMGLSHRQAENDPTVPETVSNLSDRQLERVPETVRKSVGSDNNAVTEYDPGTFSKSEGQPLEGQPFEGQLQQQDCVASLTGQGLDKESALALSLNYPEDRIMRQIESYVTTCKIYRQKKKKRPSPGWLIEAIKKDYALKGYKEHKEKIPVFRIRSIGLDGEWSVLARHGTDPSIESSDLYFKTRAPLGFKPYNLVKCIDDINDGKEYYPAQNDQDIDSAGIAEFVNKEKHGVTITERIMHDKYDPFH